MKNFFRLLSDASRFFFRAQRVRFRGFRKYNGSVEDICRSIIEDAYNKKKGYFMVGQGNFCQFYCRDFGIVCNSLLKLGYKKQVVSTLRYALDLFRKEGKITTHITKSGKPVDFPNHTPESAAYMLHCVLLTKDKKLMSEYKEFFSLIAKDIYENDINKETGLLRKDVHFSSMKDHSLRISDCYNNSMLGMFASDLKKARIKSPLSGFDYADLLVKYFWSGKYFLEDLSQNNFVSGDANVFPFWTGVIKNKKMLSFAVESIRTKRLDCPWPLKYASSEDVPKNFNFGNLLVPGYETDSLWIHLGLCYIRVVEGYDKNLFRMYVHQYASLVSKHKNFFELYFSDGRVFRRPLFVSDEGMIWAADFLEMYLRCR